MATMLQSSLGNNRPLDKIPEQKPVTDPFSAYDDIESVSMMDYAPFTTENVSKVPKNESLASSNVKEVSQATTPSNWNAFNDQYFRDEYDMLTDVTGSSLLTDESNNLKMTKTIDNMNKTVDELLQMDEQRKMGHEDIDVKKIHDINRMQGPAKPFNSDDLLGQYSRMIMKPINVNNVMKREDEAIEASFQALPEDLSVREQADEAILLMQQALSNGPAEEIPEVQQKPKQLSKDQLEDLTKLGHHTKMHEYNGKKFNKDEIQKMLFGRKIDSNNFGTYLNQNQDKLGFELKRSKDNKVLMTHGLWDNLVKKALGEEI